MAQSEEQPLSPYIAASLRQQRLEAEQRKTLQAVVDELTPFSRDLGLSFEERLASLKSERRARRRNAQNELRRRAKIANAPRIDRINRHEIIRRDRSICWMCGKTCEPHEIHLDHVIPLSKGGPHTADNLRVACAPCNMAKSDTLLSDALR